MTDLSDVNMEGVKPMGDMQELPAGKYVVRIENSEKKVTKDRFYEDGRPHEDNGKNFYLLFDLKVYGGPNDGQIEFVRLNLWNTNATAVNMAKAELKSIQDACGVHTAKSDDLHNQWMLLEIKPGYKDANKLYKHYAPVPPSIKTAYKDVPPVPAKTQQQADMTGKSASAPIAAAPAPAGDQIPDWAKKK